MLAFAELINKKNIVISCAVLWQHVFQIVVCVLSALQRATRMLQGAQYTVHGFPA
jgi:hypothetical protein